MNFIFSFNKIISIHEHMWRYDRAFVLLLQKMLRNLFLTSINIHCKSIVDKYKGRPQSLDHISLIEFVVEHNTKNHKKSKHNKIIHWVSFNLHDPQNHYRKLLLLLKPFRETETNFKENFVTWNNAYITSKNDLKKTPKKIVYIFNQNDDYNNEWDNLQSLF